MIEETNRPLDCIAQLADGPWPAMALEQTERVGQQRLHCLHGGGISDHPIEVVRVSRARAERLDLTAPTASLERRRDHQRHLIDVERLVDVMKRPQLDR